MNRDPPVLSTQPSNSLLVVNSDDQQLFDINGFRIDSTTPGRILINKQRPLLFGYLTRLALIEMNIQWNTPNVNNFNNSLTVKLFSATDTVPAVTSSLGFIRINVNNNFYTPDELQAELQSELNSEALGGLTFVVSYDEQEACFTIEQTATYPSGRIRGYFQLFSSNAPRSVTGFDPIDDDILYLTGLQAIQTGTGFYSLITGALAPMLYTPYVDVVSNILTKHQKVLDGSTSNIFTSSKLCRIYFSNDNIINRQSETASTVCNIPGTRPFIFRREFSTPKQIQWNNTENVDAVDIQVLDFRGKNIVIEEQFVSIAGTNNIISLREGDNTSFQFSILATEAGI